MLRILSACVRTRSNLTLASVMQSAAVILGFVLIAFMVCYSGMKQLSTLALILYELFWCFCGAVPAPSSQTIKRDLFEEGFSCRFHPFQENTCCAAPSVCW